MKVFRPFFVSLDLPYSIIRGEIVSIPVVVFNYFSEEVTAEVTLKNEGEFEFSDAANEVEDTPSKFGLLWFSFVYSVQSLNLIFFFKVLTEQKRLK